VELEGLLDLLGEHFSPPVFDAVRSAPDEYNVLSAATVAMSPGKEYRTPLISRKVRADFSGSL